MISLHKIYRTFLLRPTFFTDFQLASCTFALAQRSFLTLYKASPVDSLRTTSMLHTPTSYTSGKYCSVDDTVIEGKNRENEISSSDEKELPRTRNTEWSSK